MSVRSKASIAQPTLDELIKQGHFIRYSGLSVASQASSFELPEGDTVPIKSALDSRLQPYQQNGIANAAWACGADKLWREGYLGTGTVIGIIDNGCDLTAEPLQVCPDGRKKILSYYKDLKTTIEDYDEVYRNGSTGTPALWHGTSVASIAAGYSKDGYKGVAPGAQLRIYETLVDIEVAALLERPQDIITIANNNWARCIYKAVNEGCDIINCSFTAYIDSPTSPIFNLLGPFAKALQYAKKRGVLVCVAAGNQGLYEDLNGVQIYDVFGVLTGGLSVAAASVDMDTGDIVRAAYSAYNNTVDIMAVGDSCLVYTNNSLVPDDDSTFAESLRTKLGPNFQQTRYMPMNGTSFASPTVAGFAALLRNRWLKQNGFSQFYSMPGETLREIIVANTIDIFAENRDIQSGYGFATVLDEPRVRQTFFTPL